MKRKRYQYRCLHEVVEMHALEIPETVALILRDQHITYGELNRRSNRLAHYLISFGIKVESCVGISLDRSIEFVISMIAVMKSGAAYVSLDRAFPRERLVYMCADANLSALICSQEVSAELPESGARMVELDSEGGEIEQCCSSNPNVAVSLDHIAHVIYTSGSQGKPKGVQVTHRSALGFVFGVPYLEVDQNNTFLQWSSVSWDAVSLEMWLAFRSGARCVLFPGQIPTPDQLRQVIETYDISIAWLSASLLNVMIETELEALSRLQILLTGSETVSLSHVRRALPSLPHTLVVNGYGPSECGVISTAYAVMREMPENIKSVPIGRQIGDRRAYLLGAGLRQVPVGASGEIYIGGPGIGRGYLNHPDLTAERFIPDPFSQHYGARLYRTGDMARYLQDKNIEFTGRRDNQVKIRGHRIELEEIESILERHQDVGQSVVVAREDQPGNKRLVAYVVRHSRSIVGTTGSDEIEFWPSVECHYLIDNPPYNFVANEQKRLETYDAAIREAVTDKIVLDISTEPDATLARMCVEAGARRVYAIRVMEDIFQKAKARITSLSLDDRIIVKHGDVSSMDLPEQADLCVIALVGSIGGSDGVGPILNGARRLLKPGAAIIPRRCVTRIAAVRLPQELRDCPRFSQASRQYVDQLFKAAGLPFDLRLTIRNFPLDHIMSDSAVFEDLEFSERVPDEETHSIRLTIQQPGSIDGFLLWMNLAISSDDVTDILHEGDKWAPVFFPVFYPGLEVDSGDIIEAVSSRRPCIENRRNPDYQVDFRVIGMHGTSRLSRYRSPSFERSFQSSLFYQRLFNAEVSVSPPEQNTHTFVNQLRILAAKHLPDYMLPSAYVLLDCLPRLPNGKLHREALPMPKLKETACFKPLTPFEETVANIFAEALGLAQVGIHDDFFDVGGNSLIATRIVSCLRSVFRVDISPRTFFEQPTVAHLAEAIQDTIVMQDRMRNITSLSTRITREVSYE